jgi:hypothetical protein
MPLVVIQTTIPGRDQRPFRISEVLDRVADSSAEALDVAAIHIGGDRDIVLDLLTVRWHDAGKYWLVSYEPAPEFCRRERVYVN